MVEEIDVATMSEKVEVAPMDGERVVIGGSEAMDANQYPIEVGLAKQHGLGLILTLVKSVIWP